MATTFSPNVKLGKPATADAGWDATLNASLDVLDALASLSGGCVSPAEIPSASLNVRVGALNYARPDGTIGAYAGSTSFALTASATNSIYLDASYALTKSTTGFPATAHIRLGVAVVGVSTITSITDARVYLGVLLPLTGLTLADAANLAAGTTAGSKIGTSVSQKLGFWNATPIVQPSGASQAAASQTQTALTDSTGGTPSTTLAAIAAGAAYAQADLVAAKNALASLAAELALVKTDVAALVTLANALRTAGVNSGLIKGSA